MLHTLELTYIVILYEFMFPILTESPCNLLIVLSGFDCVAKARMVNGGK